MSLAIIYLEVIIMLIPNDLIKKFNSNFDKNINKLNKKRALLLKSILVILLILFLVIIIKNQNKLLS